MQRITRLINYALIALVFAAPFAVMYGCEKQERIFNARRGQ